MVLEINFVDTKLSHDWSVVAWGQNGSVTVKHSEGLVSDKLPLIERRQKQPDPDPIPSPDDDDFHDHNDPPPLDKIMFDYWGFQEEGIPANKCTSLATKVVDERQWVMARNNCARKTVHAFVINKAEWRSQVVYKSMYTAKHRRIKCDPITPDELICDLHLKPYEFKGFVMAPFSTGVTYSYSKQYGRKFW